MPPLRSNRLNAVATHAVSIRRVPLLRRDPAAAVCPLFLAIIPSYHINPCNLHSLVKVLKKTGKRKEKEKKEKKKKKKREKKKKKEERKKKGKKKEREEKKEEKEKH